MVATFQRRIHWYMILSASLTAVLSLPMAGGCGATGASPGPGQGAVQGSIEAEATDGQAAALAAVFAAEGSDREVVFFGSSAAGDAEQDPVAAALAEAIDVPVVPESRALRDAADLPVLTPVDSQTGMVGITLTLSDFTQNDNGSYRAIVTYARNGLDGGIIAVTLEHDGRGWVVQDMRVLARA